MARIADTITGINGVSPGGVATVEIPTGRRYHGLFFNYKGNANQATIEADILSIRLVVGGYQVREIIPAELFKENAANGIAFRAGRIPIFFSEPWRATVMEEEATSWDTRGQTTFEVQFLLAAGAVAPTIRGKAIFDYIPNDGQVDPTTGMRRPGSNIVHWKRNTIVVASAGDIDVKTLPKGLVQRVTFFGPTSAPTAVKVSINDRTAWDLFRDEGGDVLSDYGIVQQAGTLALAYDFTQQIIGAQPIGDTDDYNVKLSTTDAQNILALTQVRKPGYA